MSVADELRKLVELRDAGHLDQEEFDRLKARLLNSQTPVTFGRPDSTSGSNPYGSFGASSMGKKLRRSTVDRWLGGVCGGLAVYTGTESWMWRLLFAISVCFAGFGLLPYVLLWIFVPPDTQP